jgi:formylglycine-generating enzyme required for sulfatase activity
MHRLKALLECVGLALCDKGRKAFQGERSFGDVLPDVAKAALDLAHKAIVADDIRHALALAASAPAWDYDETMRKVVDGLGKVQSVPFRDELIDYLAYFPASVRQVLRRPSDPDGKTAPDKLEFYKGEELLLFLPPRPPKFRPGPAPAGCDHWELGTLRGLGECSEVWEAYDDDHPDQAPVALKFAIDYETVMRVRSAKSLFETAFGLNDIPGIVPLRTVYFDTEPPAFEYGFVPGYDLTSLMNDWKWRYDAPKPEAALKLMRRLAGIVAQAHDRRVIHRDLKPSNVLLHPTHDGKFTMWVTDYGWGQIESARSLELARSGTPRGEQLRLSLRGAHTPLYASPQQQKKDPPDLRDDVHALGVIWYQLLKRDPHSAGPVGSEWAEAFEPYGFTESQEKLLTSCLAVRPEKRPTNARDLAEQLMTVEIGPNVGPDGSRLISLKSTKSSVHVPKVVSVRGQVVTEDDSAAKAAAGLLSVEWGSGMSLNVGKASDLPTVLRNSLGMTFALVSPSTFEMGAFEDEKGRHDHELPRHTVKWTKPFYISTHLVTQAMYEQVTGKNPSAHTRSKGGSPDHPVESVGWHDAEKFCAKLGKVREEDQNHHRYRLPFEAEWELACRAGTESPFWCGQKLCDKEAVFNGGSKGKTAPVGRRAANPFGLYDVHGNVAEWCMDWYDEYYYFDSPTIDPHGPKHGLMKVTRGGSYASLPTECRSAARAAHAPDRPGSTIGFRVVLMVNA